ncbi:unnamed protein product [Brassica oleracea]
MLLCYCYHPSVQSMICAFILFFSADPFLSSFISPMAADELFVSESSLCGEATSSAKKTFT